MKVEHVEIICHKLWLRFNFSIAIGSWNFEPSFLICCRRFGHIMLPANKIMFTVGIRVKRARSWSMANYNNNCIIGRTSATRILILSSPVIDHTSCIMHQNIVQKAYCSTFNNVSFSLCYAEIRKSSENVQRTIIVTGKNYWQIIQHELKNCSYRNRKSSSVTRLQIRYKNIYQLLRNNVE